MTYRIFEIDDTGQRSVAGWADHASMASARAAIEAWGKIVCWNVDREFDAVDVLIIAKDIDEGVQLAVERISRPSGTMQ